MKKFEISANKSFDGMEVRHLLQEQGIPQQPGTRKIAFYPVYFVLKNENVKDGFVLQNPPFYFRMIPLLENEWNALKNKMDLFLQKQ